jgi:hypothetical protein
MSVSKLIVLSILLLIANLYAAENLFVRSSGLQIKGKLFSKLYREATAPLPPDAGVEETEDRVAVIARSAPLLGTQAILSAFVCSNCMAQLFNVIPRTFTTRIRQQCLLVIIAVKLIDLYRELDIAPFEMRDNLFSDDLVQRAVTEVRTLAGGPIGRTLSYYCLCLSTVSNAEGCLAPFAIGELPNLVRFGLIAVTAASAARDSQAASTRALSQLLFPVPDSSTEPSSSNSTDTSLDRICIAVSDALEVFVVVRALLRLLDFRAGGAVRGTPDMLLLAVQLLLIQNYLTLRAREVLGKRGAGSMSMQSVLSALGVEQLSSYVQPIQAWVREIVASVQRIVDANTRTAAWNTLQSALGIGARPRTYKKVAKKAKRKLQGSVKAGPRIKQAKPQEKASREEAAGKAPQAPPPVEVAQAENAGTDPSAL